MTSWQVVGLVGALLLIDLAIIGAVIAAVGRPLRELAAKYPPREPAGDAVFKEFQSARIGMSNWGGCMHVGVDAKHLHLRPAWLARRFGMKPMSLPWEDIAREPGQPTFKDRQRGLGRAKVGTIDVSLPRWALSMIEGEEPGDARVP